MEDQNTAYCPSCREDRVLLDAEPVRIPSGSGTQEALKGTCAVCGVAIISITSKETR